MYIHSPYHLGCNVCTTHRKPYECWTTYHIIKDKRNININIFIAVNTAANLYLSTLDTDAVSIKYAIRIIFEWWNKGALNVNWIVKYANINAKEKRNDMEHVRENLCPSQNAHSIRYQTWQSTVFLVAAHFSTEFAGSLLTSWSCKIDGRLSVSAKKKNATKLSLILSWKSFKSDTSIF